MAALIVQNSALLQFSLTVDVVLFGGMSAIVLSLRIAEDLSEGIRVLSGQGQFKPVRGALFSLIFLGFSGAPPFAGFWTRFCLFKETVLNGMVFFSVTLMFGGLLMMYVYLNNPDFQDGGKTNLTPYFVALMEDSDGINATGSGVGHDLELIIDGTTSYVLNDYYTNEFGTYTKGSVRFSIPELEPGKHRLVFRAWDMMGNSSSQMWLCDALNVNTHSSWLVMLISISKQAHLPPFVCLSHLPSGLFQQYYPSTLYDVL